MSKGKNLKGKLFSQQISNIINRTLNIEKSKRESEKQNQIHSINTLEFRQRLLNDFKTYLQSQNITTGKMNQYFNEEHLRRFLFERVVGLKYSSSKTIISGMSGIINSLKETNVSINLSSDFFTTIKNEIKEVKYTYQSSKEVHKSFLNVDKVIDGLYDKKTSYGVLGEVLRESGFRYQEGINLLQYPNKYIQDNKVIGMKGKSGKVYQDKTISNELKEKIYSLSNSDKKINHKSFCNAIGSIEESKTPHSFRYQFVKEKYKLFQSRGLSHSETMKILSNELNHYRNTTPYYLNRI